MPKNSLEYQFCAHMFETTVNIGPVNMGGAGGGLFGAPAGSNKDHTIKLV
jgi:hypothetical protein